MGFGWSEKAPKTDYSHGTLWAEPLAAFAEEVSGARRAGSRQVALAGNSLDGYAALTAASRYPDLFAGVCLLNSAGRFEDELDWSTGTRSETGTIQPVSPLAPAWRLHNNAFLRLGLLGAFAVARQLLSIRNVLEKLYVSGIHEDLVDSIVLPTSDAASPEVFCRILTANGLGKDAPLEEQQKLTLDPMLRTLCQNGIPLLLLWGMEDPWIRESKLERLQGVYPEADKVLVSSGHCPHDDTPEEVNEALVKWLSSLGLKVEGGTEKGSPAQ